MNGTIQEKRLGKKQKLLALSLAVLLVAVVLAFLFLPGKMTGGKKKEPEVLTVSTLERIINVSELSTFTAVYNGIAQIMNNENVEEIDYYVSYEARVDAGIDFKKIDITIDDKTKTIKVDIPDVYITGINVDISSLDFIFCNNKADASSVTQAAFKACEADVQEESAQQDAILELAQQNAVNVVTALVNPLIEQADADYTLVVE